MTAAFLEAKALSAVPFLDQALFFLGFSFAAAWLGQTIPLVIVFATLYASGDLFLRGGLWYPLSRRGWARVVLSAMVLKGMIGAALAVGFLYLVLQVVPGARGGIPGAEIATFIAIALAWGPAGAWGGFRDRQARISTTFLPGLLYMPLVWGTQGALNRWIHDDPVALVGSLVLVAVVVHGSAWVLLHRHFARCPLGPGRV